jgi:hypothetical protein
MAREGRLEDAQTRSAGYGPLAGVDGLVAHNTARWAQAPKRTYPVWTGPEHRSGRPEKGWRGGMSMVLELFLFYAALFCLVVSAMIFVWGILGRRRLQAWASGLSVGAWSVVAFMLWRGPW